MHKMMTNSDLYRTIKLPEGVIRQLYEYEKKRTAEITKMLFSRATLQRDI